MGGIVRLPLTGVALRLVHVPAYCAGWGLVQDYLERGYAAFKWMDGADEFLHTVYRHEIQILDRIYASHPDPFALDFNLNQTALWSD